MIDLCALCVPGVRQATSVRIEGVPLCAEHGRIVAMKRLGITAADLAPAQQEQGDPR